MSQINVLFISGPANGDCVVLDSLSLSPTFIVMKQRTSIHIPEYEYDSVSAKWNDAIQKEYYFLRELGGRYFYVHTDKLAIPTIDLLIQKYPKRRKSKRY